YWQCLTSGRLFFRLCVNSTCFAFFRDLLRLFCDRPCPTYSRRPCSAFRFFAAYSAFLIASFNLRCLSFLLRCVFLLASSCHELPRSQVSGYNNAFRAWLGPTFVL